MNLLHHLGFNKKRKVNKNYRLALSEFNKSLSLIIDRDQLKANVVSKLQEIVKVDKVFLFLYDEDYHKYLLTDTIGTDKNQYSRFYFTPKDKLIYWLSVNEKHVVLSQNEGLHSYFSPKEQEMLNEMDISYIHPLKVMNSLIGIILFGKKSSGTEYKNDEIELLTILLDQAAFAFENANLFQQQKDRIRKMYRADRLAIMGQLAAGAAHEIRNPLTSIRTTIQYVKNEIKDPVKAKMTTGLIDEVDRINEIIQGLLTFSNPNKLSREKIDLEQLINQTILLVSNTARKRSCNIEITYNTEKKDLIADAAQLKQVFLNIIMNALQAMNDKGEIKITIDWSTKNEKGFDKTRQEYIIAIEDNGEGISQENLEKIFDPFFTTKNDGTGLGLSISYGIIIQHGGDIAVESKEGKGTKVTIKLPEG